MPCLHLALNVPYLHFGLVSLLRWKQPYIYQMDSRAPQPLQFCMRRSYTHFKNGKPVASRHIIQALQNPRLGILRRQCGDSVANVYRSTCYKKEWHNFHAISAQPPYRFVRSVPQKFTLKSRDICIHICCIL